MRIESVSIIDASRPRRQGAEGGGGQVRDGAVAAYRIGRIASRDRSFPAQGTFRALRSARSLTVDLPLPFPLSVLLISYWRSAAGGSSVVTRAALVLFFPLASLCTRWRARHRERVSLPRDLFARLKKWGWDRDSRAEFLRARSLLTERGGD